MTGDFISHLGGERPAYPVTAPAITCHTLYRIRGIENPRWATDEAEKIHRWNAFCKSLTDYVRKAQTAFGQPETAIFVAPVKSTTDIATHISIAPPQYSVNQTALIGLAETRAFRARLRIDVYSESYAITHIIDRIAPDAEAGVNKRVHDIIAGNEENPSWCYNEFWTSSDKGFGALHSHRTLLPGEQFAEFRGLVLPASLDGKMSPATDAPVQRGETALCKETQIYLERRQGLIRTFQQASLSSTDGTNTGAESVLCGMVGGRALYVSPLVRWGVGLQPVRYLAVYAGENENQLGRFIRRLHVMGELRHSALLDFDRGHSRTDLRSISQDLRNAGWRLDALIKEGDTSYKSLQSLNNDLAALNNHIEGGLAFRIEQARYYSSAFRERLQDLRIVRVEGWQPYDEFVRRYIFQLFDKIDRLGRRYEALGRRIDRWTFLAEVRGTEQYHLQITDTTTRIRELTANLKDVEERGARILKTAEMFAIITLVYYVGSVLKHSFSAHEEWFNAAWLGVMILVGLDAWLASGKISTWFFSGLKRFLLASRRGLSTFLGSRLRSLLTDRGGGSDKQDH